MPHDIVIRNATIVDGTGASPFAGSVGIRGNSISAVGDVQGDAGRVIDGSGLVVCPGFVDPHSHADLAILQFPLAENLVMQGVTTFVGGNCALSLAPIVNVEAARGFLGAMGVDVDLDWHTFDEWLSRAGQVGCALNHVPLVGHAAIRTAVMGDDFKREATAGEIEEMKALVADAMASGAYGLSTCLDPGVGEYAAQDEIVALAQVAARYGGLYAPHTRHTDSQWPSDDPDEYGYGIYHGPLEDVWVGRYRGYLEAIEIARKAGIPLHIAHLSTAFNVPQPHPASLDACAAEATLEIIDQAVTDGVDVTFDTIACSSSIASERPLMSEFLQSKNIALAWLNALEKEDFVARLRTGTLKDEIRRVYDAGRLKLGMIQTRADPYWMDCFRIVRCEDAMYAGKTVAEIAAGQSEHPLDVLFDILIADPAATWVQFIDKRLPPAAITTFLKHPRGMPSSDMTAFPVGDGPVPMAAAYGDKPPAIAFGLYADYIGTYVRDEAILSLEEAVRKATSAPAQRFGLADRGVLRERAYADVVVFDLARIRGKGDFSEPAQRPEGIACVLVNGQIVYMDGAHTGAIPGIVHRRQ